jgi:hypothetical protein
MGPGLPGGLGALRALPAPHDDEHPLIGAIRALLPERSAEDKARGEIPLHFGTGDTSETVRIPVLFTKANRAWQDQFKARMTGLVNSVEADSTGSVVMDLLTGSTDVQTDLLAAYNPERMSKDWLEDHATEEQILAAFLQVTAASFPFVLTAARTLLASPEVGRWVRQQIVQFLYSQSSSSSPPNTAGAPTKSKKG